MQADVAVVIEVDPTAPPRSAFWRLNWGGLVGAIIAFGLALTPSLLPRPGLFLGFIAGVSAVIGYGFGTFLSWALRWMGVPEPSVSAKRIAWRVLMVAGPVLVIAALIWGGVLQNQVRELVGEAPDSPALALAFVVALIVAAVLLLASRGIRRVTRWVTRQFARFLPRRVAQAIGVVLVILVGYWLAAGLLFNGFVDIADNIYSGTNSETAPGIVEPTSPDLSGSPESLVPWSTLGFQGRSFIGGGPTTAQLTAFNRKPATQPIRVYVGLDSAPTATSRAALAVKELERTGAFDRPVLVVAGATGTGWLEPQAVDSLEYMWNGNSAIVTTQYSFLPSWISFLVDKERAADAGRELFDAVHAAWAARPEGHRPKLIVYGLSLGSFAAQSAFTSPADVATRTDGALFIGTPDFTDMWGTVTRTRDAGSPEWQPIYRSGTTVRFASSLSDLANPAQPWVDPRMLYVQHASDPVVWWSPSLIAQKPNWLAEPRGPDVSPNMHWIPVVTFLQVTVDQFFGTTVPLGHGHNYANNAVGSWAAVVTPPGWAFADTNRLQQLIDAYPTDEG